MYALGLDMALGETIEMHWRRGGILVYESHELMGWNREASCLDFPDSATFDFL